MTFTLGADGQLQSITDENGQATGLAYDPSGRLMQTAAANGGFATVTTVALPTGSRTTFTSPEGVGTALETAFLSGGGRELVASDASGLRLERTENPDGSRTTRAPNGTVMTTVVSPDPLHGMEAPLRTVTIMTPSGLTSTVRTAAGVTLDEFGDLLTRTDSTIVNGRVTVARFDQVQGRATITYPSGRQRTAQIDEAGRVTRDSLPGLVPTSLAYDPAGRVEAVTRGSRTWRYAYDPQGDLRERFDAAGRVWRFDYDAGGRPALEVSPGGDTTRVAYDPAGNVTAITPPGGQAHRFTYSDVNLATSYQPPDAGDGAPPLRMSYGLDGRITHAVRQSGDTIAFTYDSLGRIVGRRTAEGETTVRYDPATGQRVEYTSWNGTTLGQVWDGPLATRATWEGPVAGSVSVTYDVNQRVLAESLNDAHVATLGYDADGRLQSAGALTFGFDPANGLTTSATLGAVASVFTYNAFGALTAVTTTHAGAPLLEQRYLRDNLGRVTSLVEMLGAGPTDSLSFGYDPAGRLTTVSRNGALQTTYEYDRNGNLIRVTGSAGTVVGNYDAQDRLLTYGASALGYTRDGDLRFRATGPDTTWYRYSAVGELLAVVLPDGTDIEYVVDPLARRVGKRVNGTLVRGWLYRGQLAPAAELDGQGAVVSRFVYGSRPNVPEYMQRDGRTYRFVTDRLGSVRLVVDVETGTIAQRVDYDAFGRVTFNTAPGFQPFGFAGGLYDEQTDLVRFGARDYDASIGRWTTRDPLLFQGGATNLYTYANGDPVNTLDPSGFYTLPELQVAQNEDEKLSNAERARFKQRLDRLRKLACNVAEKATNYTERAYRALDVFHQHHIVPERLGLSDETTSLYGLWHITDLHPLLTVALKINGLWGLNSPRWDTASDEQKRLAAQAVLKATRVFDQQCGARDPDYKPITPRLERVLEGLGIPID